MTTHQPVVTVVIPLFNGEAHIAETLDSVHAQTFRDFEVLVVDDGSKDAGPHLVQDHPVGARLVEQAHFGVAVARNRGLLEARGDWVTFLDQDDLWHPSRLLRLVGWLAEHPDERVVATEEVEFATEEEVSGLTAADPLVGGWASHHVPEVTALRTLCETVDVSGSDDVRHYDHRAMLRGPVTASTSFIADPQILRLAGGFAPHALAMDDYWLLVNAARLCPIAKVDHPTVFYRVHLGATSRTTRLALPFLSSAVALRLGGGLISRDEGLSEDTTGPLHAHLLHELLNSSEYSDRRVRAAARRLSALLWPDGQGGEHRKAEIRLRAPWAVPTLRRVRGLLSPGPRRIDA